ncbi:hypothetical protein JI739_01690 [Ramlibacter sp. AW1]|uniref:Uncharacterized protein n=1 Tax=Ramlibacter aurantiacus TaxID=2801330 RepID=A0A937D4M6_9BURK|nr:hypothetical protein [Ramlibacter aurantiacus]MBL0419048.1 hypothetical protein [Ramlibacter aurantiacus]
MQMNELKQRIDKVEECTDQAKHSLQSGSASTELAQCVQQMHQQAHQLQQACSQQNQQQMGQDSLRQQVEQLEQLGDRAMQACRRAGNVDPQMQQSVQRAHDEISSLKKQMQMG